MARRAVAVVGASGFIGHAIARAFAEKGWNVDHVRAPRITGPTRLIIPDRPGPAATEYLQRLLENTSIFHNLVHRIAGADTVINAAGVPHATSAQHKPLLIANSYLPSLIAAAAQHAGLSRMIHISSAAVQGRISPLDESARFAPFSPYSASKALGEILLLQRLCVGFTTIYRPPAVHGHERIVTQQLARLARSPLSTVASPGNMPTAQTLSENVADAVTYIAEKDGLIPSIVMHPHEGLTVTSLLEHLGRRSPRQLPRTLLEPILLGLRATAVGVPAVAGVARRAESLWLGQSQGDSWLTLTGWTPPLGKVAWQQLGAYMTRAHQRTRKTYR